MQIAPELGADPGLQLHGIEGLGDVIVRPHVEAQHLVGILALGGEQGHRDVGEFPELGQGADPVHHRHHDVQQHQMDVLPVQDCQGLPAVGGGKGPIALGLQVDLQGGDDILFVVADQNVVAHVHPSAFKCIIPSRSLRTKRVLF